MEFLRDVANALIADYLKGIKALDEKPSKFNALWVYQDDGRLMTLSNAVLGLDEELSMKLINTISQTHFEKAIDILL